MSHTDREIVIVVPLPEPGLAGTERHARRRHRQHLVDLGPRLRAFRTEHGVTQEEVARVVGAADRSAVAAWELGIAVPDGMRRERAIALLAGQLGPELRAAMIEVEGLPSSWERAARWYRRASRERRACETAGRAVAAVMDSLRAVAAAAALRERYLADDAGEARAAMVARLPDGAHGAALRQAEDAAYGLRWLELERGVWFDLGRSLARQLPLAWLDDTERDGESTPTAHA